MIEYAHKHAAAGAFKLYHEFLSLPGGLKGELSTDEAPDIRAKRFAIRELIMLQEIAAAWYAPGKFVADILAGADAGTIAELAQGMEALIGAELLSADTQALKTFEQWGRFCHTLFHACQDQALAKVEKWGVREVNVAGEPTISR